MRNMTGRFQVLLLSHSTLLQVRLRDPSHHIRRSPAAKYGAPRHTTGICSQLPYARIKKPYNTPTLSPHYALPTTSTKKATSNVISHDSTSSHRTFPTLNNRRFTTP